MLISSRIHKALLTGLLALVIIGGSGCRAEADTERLVPAPSGTLPQFKDDRSMAGLEAALTLQLAAFANETDRRDFLIGDIDYSFAHLVATVEAFRALVRQTEACLLALAPGAPETPCFDTMNAEIGDRFRVFSPEPPVAGNTNLTAYYTPTISVSEVKQGAYQFPIYGPPSADLKGATRVEIDFDGALAGHGYELFYARELFDIYVLQLEGGGKLQVDDGSGGTYTKFLLYSAANGQPFRFLFDYMVDQGMLAPGNTSTAAQRTYLRDHPERAREIFTSSPAYVYFRASDTVPVGSRGAPLTAGRSIATDPAYYPVKGLPTYIVTQMPVFQPGADPESNPGNLAFTPLERFFIDQDTGPAVLGPDRVDIFFGDGDRATFLGNNFAATGDIYFLLLR